MKVPKSFEGCMVSMHLARPVYQFEYAAHVSMFGKDLLMAAPVMKQVPGANPGDPMRVTGDLSEVVIGALVEEALEDSIVVKLFLPDRDGKGGVIMRRCIPSALILDLEEVFEYDAALPQMVRRMRAGAEPVAPSSPPSKIII